MLFSLSKSRPTALLAGVCVTLASLSAVPGQTGRLGDEAPDRTDLLIYVLCSDTAAERPLSMAEAVACGRIFDRVKLAFLPDVTFGEFEALSAREQHRVGLEGYARFRDWYDANPQVIEDMRKQLTAHPTAAGIGG